MIKLTNEEIINNINNNQLDKLLFEMKPCSLCSNTCVEGNIDIKCPFDSMVENLIKKEKR
jgi:hypothetical protein